MITSIQDQTPLPDAFRHRPVDMMGPPKSDDHHYHKERMAVIGEYTSMIAHEIRSPLSTIGMALEYLANMSQPEKAEKRLRLAISETQRLHALLDEILIYTRPQGLNLTRFDLGKLIREVIAGLSSKQSGQCNIDHSPLEVEEHILLMGDPDKLKQVIINLLLNACQATTTGERVDVRMHADERSGFVQIEIRNPGTIPEGLLSRITEPFVTNKQAGTGLGLAIAKRIIEEHKGELAIELPAPEEVCVRVSLPLTV